MTTPFTSTTPTPSGPPRRRGFFAWLRALFRPAPVGPPVDLVVSEYRTGGPIEVPAEGGVFHLTVSYDLTWSARGMSRAALNRWIDVYQDSAVRALRTAIWPVGRDHLPQHAESAERAMNDVVRAGWCFGDAGEIVSCVAAVQVVSDARVLDLHRPLWDRFVELDLRYRVEHRRIDHLVELLTRWRRLLADFGSDPVVIQAATLTDTKVAEAIDGLAARQLALGTDLITVLEKSREAHGQVGLFEMAQSYDAAVRLFERQTGLPAGTVSQGKDAL
jgi:hypothetical protein